MSLSPAAPGTIVEARDLTVSYGGQKVLDVPLFQVNRNEVMVIVGPNGSGKTTLLLCLTRLINPQTGMVSYDGRPVADRQAVLRLHRRVAVVFQESLLLNSTVWDNVTLGLRLRKVKHEEAKNRARLWLERFGIAHLARRQARTLSSGEGKRASLARAFALHPEVLFLDEPFTALDSPTRQALLEDFEGVLRETKVTTVMVTHDRNEALALADRVVVLLNGRIAQAGPPAEVFSSPQDEEVAGFVEAGNILRGTVAAQADGLATILVAGKHLEVASDFPDGTEVIVLLAYDDVIILLPSQERQRSSARNCLPGEVVRLFPTGFQVRVTIDCGFPLAAMITRQSAEEMGLQKGTPVYATFKAISARVIRRN
jgi:tungstate transport system ATP-binding protein